LALPHLLKYVYTHGSDEVIRRGKKIHALGYVELAEHDELFSTVTFRVKDDTYATFYKVSIQNYKDAKTVSLRCSCPYNLGDICRHESAALLRLQELIDKGMLFSDNSDYDQHHTVAKMKALETKAIRMLSSQDIYVAADEWLRENKPVIESAKEETVKAKVKLGDAEYYVIIRRNEERTFDTSSDYVDSEHLLCLPKVIVFLYLYYTHGTNYFDTIRNWDKEKNKLLELYGYALTDDLKGKFEFTYKDGKPYLRVLDTTIKRVAVATPVPVHHEEVFAEAETQLPGRAVSEGKRLGLVFNFNKPAYPFFSIEVIRGDANSEGSFTDVVQKLELAKYINLDAHTEEEKALVTQVRKLQETEINKYINRNSPFSGFWENIVHHEGDELTEETKTLVAEYMIPKLKKLSVEGLNAPLFILRKGQGI
jgi:non-specific serine/threonine protein kinase